MRTTAVGPAGLREKGRVYDLPPAEAQPLLRYGNAELVDHRGRPLEDPPATMAPPKASDGRGPWSHPGDGDEGDGE